jgi:hypothetical protein
VLAANNDGPLRIFAAGKSKGLDQVYLANLDSKYADITLKNGKQYKVEFYYGSGYLSQRSRSILLNNLIKEIRVTDFTGKSKIVYSNEEVN